MKITQLEYSGKSMRTPLVNGNEALRQGDYAKAIANYATVITQQPELTKSISANLALARKKYRAGRQSSVKPSIAVCGWELAHNAAGRVYTLATLYETFANVEIIGSIFPGFGREIWEPIRDTPIAKHAFIVEDESEFLEQSIQLVADHPYDIVHLSKPRAPNIFFGFLYKLFWNAKVLMDIDDEELAFVGVRNPICIDEFFKKYGKLPRLKDLPGKDWTRLAVGMAKQFDGVTVSNAALQKRYGGEIIRHARSEKLFNPSPALKYKSRDRYGIPQDKKVVLFFGTPRDHKGLMETAHAIAALSNKNVLFMIVGDFPNQSFKDDLQKIVGCEFLFIKNQPFKKIPQVIAVADCCVFLQDDSSVAKYQVPAKITDALGMGVPVLASATPALEDFILNDSIIKTSNKNLVHDLANVLTSPALSESQFNTGRNEFLQRLSISACSANLKNWLSNLSELNNDKLILRNAQLLFSAFNMNGDLFRGVANLYANFGVKQKHLAPSSISNDMRIDVVVPVFNALDDVKNCIKSIEAHTDGFKVRIVIVNDGSDEQTTLWIRQYCQNNKFFNLIENSNNIGYTRSINAGLKSSNADYLVTLNSDTLVASGWLKGLVRCMESDQKIGIVGPLSNAASWQNVPILYDESGGFAVNNLPDGLDVQGMAQLVAKASHRTYPRITFINGFCFMIRRAVIDAIGYMDEENFPVGYGEENDYCIRAIDAGFELAVADDVFVFHAKSKSFGHERRKLLSEQGAESLKLKHTPAKYASRVNAIRRTEQLDAVRARIQQVLDQQVVAHSVNFTQMRILFLLPVKGGGGGAHSVVQEAYEMRRLGLYVRVAMKYEQVAGFLKNYADIPDVKEIFIGFDDSRLIELAEDFDVVVGTVFTTLKLVKRIVDVFPHILPAYYVQDYEPMFFADGSAKKYEAQSSYTMIYGALLFAKTQWIIDEVKKNHDVPVYKVQPSIDHEVYMPKCKARKGKMQITAMIRPQTPYRGAERTMRLLAKLYKHHGNLIDIHVFGCDNESPEFQKLERDFPFQNHGRLMRPQVAELLAQSDLFIDLSDYQAFGRTGLEAMACGCAVAIPAAGGAYEYAVHQQNSLILDTADENACFEMLSQLLLNPKNIWLMQRDGLLTAARYSVHYAALSEVLLFERELNLWRTKHPKFQKPLLMLLPNMRGDGLPTGSAYVRVVLPYQASPILKNWRVRIVDSLPLPGSADFLVIQREAIGRTLSELQQWLPAWRSKGGKVIYEIDDDLFDAEGLKSRHYSQDVEEIGAKVQFLATFSDIVHVSTEPLKQVVSKFNRNVSVIPNGIDASLWRLNLSCHHDNGIYRRCLNGPVRIGYIGTHTHDEDLELIANVMRSIEKKYGDKVEIEVIGGFQKSLPTFGKRVALPKKNDYPNFVNWLHERVRWDIGIIPLVENRFNRSKSYLKFLEYAGLDLAIIVSNVCEYPLVAKHNHNSYVVENNESSWMKGLEILIEDRHLRAKLAENARKLVATTHTLDVISKKILKNL